MSLSHTQDDFWQRCYLAGCVVAPVMAYSGYGKDGNIDQQLALGLRFAALPFDGDACGPDFYVLIEEAQTGSDRLYDTPEDALSAFQGAANSSPVATHPQPCRTGSTSR